MYVGSRQHRGMVAGGDHVLREAHERNCACAPRLSLTPTHVTDEKSSSIALPPRSCRCTVVLSQPGRASYARGETDTP